MTRSIDSAKKGRGRPPVDSEAVNVRLSRELLQKVDKAAKGEGVSRPEAIRRIIARS
jgi:metal-responsive CopG/Arc/MetJ family transcriptional regulator